MIRYDELKKSKDGMPTWDSLLPVALSVILENSSLGHREYRRLIRESILDFPENLKNKYYVNGDMFTVEFRAGFAFSLLSISGIIEKDGKIYRSNKLSKEVFEKYGYSLNAKVVKTFPKYLEHIRRKNQLQDYTDKDDEIILREDFADIQENIEKYIKNYRDELAVELLERVLKEDFIFFEKLVLELLVAMGYTKHGGNAYTTSPTNDGGIDGVINADPLGTSSVYYQAKRYTSGNVSRNEIDAFYGALTRNSSSKGVFITTSNFSKGAKEAADKFSIVTIDGMKLTELMITYKVGIRTKKAYEIYDLDEDFFDNL